MDTWTQTTLAVNGRRLSCYRSGGGRPPLVLVHGFTDNARYWTRVAEALAADHEVIAYDARGHGTSDRLEGHFDDEDRVSDLHGVLDALGVERPVLMGHSMGGATIALYAVRHPARARALILEDPAWYEPEAPLTSDEAAAHTTRRRADLAAWRSWVVEIQTSPFETALAAVRAASPQWAEADARLSCAARRQVDVSVFDHYPKLWSPWRALTPQLPCPTLLLIGEPARGGLLSPAQAQTAADLNPRLVWRQISGAGHSLRYDQPAAYLDHVQTFLRALPA